MQGIFGFSKSWHHPVPSLRRSGLLVLLVLGVETLAFFLKGEKDTFLGIYLQFFVRLMDVLILLCLGQWSSGGKDIPSALKETLFIVIILSLAGFVFLAGYKSIAGTSMLNATGILSKYRGKELILFYMTSCLVSPVTEEFFFRGILYRRMRTYLAVWISVSLVSLLFALTHYYFSDQIYLPFLGSLLFCVAYEKTKSILTPILLHISGNMLIFSTPFLGFL
jgi:uncharacterized protein